MERYKNINRNSGVRSYETGPDFIRVQFSTGTIYRYNYLSAGNWNIEHMKHLAQQGYGLNSFINTRVRKAYAQIEH